MEIIENQIYKAGEEYIFQATNDNRHCDNISLNTFLFYKGSGIFTTYINANDIKHASFDEQNWFLICQAKNQYVNKPDFVLEIPEILKKLNL